MTITDHAGAGLPGQVDAAPGPHDLLNMHVMHHAFRRDLADFGSAVAGTPYGEADVWQALSRRWDRFASVLHHHHGVEDQLIWPAVERAAAQAGDLAGRAELAAMEAEHDTVDPALAACRQAFAAMAAAPGEAGRDLVVESVGRAQRLLAAHLAHE